jgi:hypothetical protein
MSTVVVPVDVPALPVMGSLPDGAVGLENDLRAALVNAKDVQAWAEAISADAFTGDASDASGHALTRFSRRLDVTEAALERAVLATSHFEDRLARLFSQSLTLDGDRTSLNGDLADLRADVAAASEADTAELQARADRLEARSTRLRDDIVAWSTRYADAEAEFVAALAAVDTVEEGRVAAADPGRVDPAAVVRTLGSDADDPAAVRRWWDRLSEAERQAVIAELPALVGNLAGVPVRYRDAANRAAVGSDVDGLTAQQADEPLTEQERDRLANASAVADVLDDYSQDVDPVTGELLAHLTQYQPDEHSGDGGVALFLGDPDVADHVSVYVPGTLSETGTLDGTIGNVDALHDAAGRSGDGTVAVGFWLDYDAPSIDGLSPGEIADLARVVTPGEAAAGGRDLADYLDGLRASDEGAPAHLSLIGHSYGATTSAYAAHDGAPVDDLVLLGSPGSPTSTAAGLTSADVHVGSADFDPITLLGASGPGLPGPLGYDPAQDSFGGQRFEVDPGSYRVQDLFHNHSSYFDGASLSNITDIVTGHDPDPVDGRHPGGYQTLDQLLVGSSAVSGGEWLWERGEDVVDGVVGSVVGGVRGLAEGLVRFP